MLWEEYQRNKNITHTAKQKKVILNGVKVDGYWPDTNQIFEFHGCYFHRNIDCFKYDRDKHLHDNQYETLNMRYELPFTIRHVAKTKQLRGLGYNVVEM